MNRLQDNLIERSGDGAARQDAPWPTLKRMFTEYSLSYSTSFLGFLVILLSARLLGAEQFAWVAAGVAFGGFIIPLTTLGSDLTFVRDAVAANDAGAIVRMAMKTFGIRVTVMLAIGGAVVIIAPFYAGSIENGIAVALLATWAGMQGLYAMAWFDYLGRTRQQNFIVLLERLTSLLLIAGMLALPAALHRAVIAGALLWVTRLASVVIQVRSWNRLLGVPVPPLGLGFPRAHPGINLRVTAASLASALMIYGNQLFLRGNPIELASYGLAFQIVGLILIFQNQTNRLVSRKIAETCRRRELILRSTLRNALFMAGGSAALAVAAFILFQFLPALLSDPKYGAVKLFAPMLCVWVVVAGVANSVVQHVLSCNAETFYLCASAVAGACAFILGLILVPVYGGVAVVTIMVGMHLLLTGANLGKLLALSKGHA